MKVAELIDELRELNSDEEIKFRVCGTATMKRDLTGYFSGVYDLDMDVDTEAELDCIDNNGEVTLWI